MTFIQRVRRAVVAMLTGAVLACGAVSTPIVIGALTPAQISEDAQIALEQYSSWRRIHASAKSGASRGATRLASMNTDSGSTPMNGAGIGFPTTSRRTGRWVVYHYGRWAFEPGIGCFWVTGDEWAPAWVNWRYGDDYFGWDQCISTFLNCQGSRLSMSSGKRPGRPVRGVQSV